MTRIRPLPVTGRRSTRANDEIDLNGKDVATAKQEMIDWLAAKGFGRPRKQYKLRDWLFSRQRYWGEPFPIVYDEDDTAIALPEDQLPLTLPPIDDYAPAKLDPGGRGLESRYHRWLGPRTGPPSSWIWATGRRPTGAN